MCVVILWRQILFIHSYESTSIILGAVQKDNSEDKRSSETSAVPNVNCCTRLRETLNGGWVTAFGEVFLTFFNTAR